MNNQPINGSGGGGVILAVVQDANGHLGLRTELATPDALNLVRAMSDQLLFEMFKKTLEPAPMIQRVESPIL